MLRQAEISPPKDYELGQKFYCRSGRFSLVLSTEYGPLDASIKFIDCAIADGKLHALGNTIDVSESGSFAEEDIILRRETCRFLNNKCGITADLLFALVANEFHNED